MPSAHISCCLAHVRSQELKACEAQNMALQKKVNKLQVEHVSEEEVDQVRERELARVPASLNALIRYAA